ncbi:MAG: Nif3-like dinuclear metal center hexameric protein [Anaerovoracaceae bacterium]|jgi:dinuclear metal center YbgI/SA1388 family protein
MKYTDVINAVETAAPPELAESWDSSGVQIFTGNRNISRILTTLDIDEDVVAEAVTKECDMIVSHHPLLFGGIGNIDADDPLGNMVLGLIKNDISVYSAHTSFDSAPEGNNVYLAKKLGLSKIRLSRDEDNGVTGAVSETASDGVITLKDLIGIAEERLGLRAGYCSAEGNPDAVVRKIGICTGAGFDFIEQARREGCQVLITGDVKHHQAMEAKQDGIAVIDAGHWGTEKSFAENMASQLRALIADVEIIESDVNTDPFMV